MGVIRGVKTDTKTDAKAGAIKGAKAPFFVQLFVRNIPR